MLPRPAGAFLIRYPDVLTTLKETYMKQVITRALLKKRRFKSNRSLWLAAGFAGLFCLICLLLIPNKLVGAGITVFVLLFGGGLYLKYRSLS